VRLTEGKFCNGAHKVSGSDVADVSCKLIVTV